MSAYTPTRHVRLIGVVTVVLCVLMLTVSFRLSTLGTLFSGGGYTLQAEFTDASGIAPGDPVRVAGLVVGEVEEIRVVRDHALVDLRITDDVQLGERTSARLSLDTLLGQHSLVLTPAGPGELAADSTIPLDRTTTPFGVTDALLQVGAELEPIDTEALTSAIRTVSGALDPAAPEVRTAATGLSELARVVSSREEQVQDLFEETAQIATTLGQRSEDIVTLIDNSALIFATLSQRQATITRLVRTTGDLAATVGAVIRENQGQLEPALKDLRSVLGVLRDHQDDLDESLRLLAPYLRYFVNLTGNGRWFDGTFAGLVPLHFTTYLPEGLR
ncbi:MCE family protein [Nocardioides caeni]|uniref:MCE family protein n=1 Tax=Nocardioides caeni TaxID=574700 RepID=A0A4V4HJ31_9ACTN|nr:MCE family protein [Nocardioides caeni]THV08836.1 MCE family protein [Nocardioides caeni]